MDCNQVCQGIQQFFGNIFATIFWAAVIIGGIILVFKLLAAFVTHVTTEVRGAFDDICGSPLGRLLGTRAHLLYLAPLSALSFAAVAYSPIVQQVELVAIAVFSLGLIFGILAAANLLSGFPSANRKPPPPIPPV
jgi:hypothetical protein